MNNRLIMISTIIVAMILSMILVPITLYDSIKTEVRI